VSPLRVLKRRDESRTTDTMLEAELRAARRALLADPWLTREGDPDEFRLVRRHREALATWFRDTLRYRFVCDAETARLRKAGIGGAPSRPLLRVGSRKPFPPKGYAILIAVLASLTRERDQLLLEDLAIAVRATAAEAGIALDLDQLADRRLLQAALRTLLDLGVLVERDGAVEGWDTDRRVQALLDIRRDRLAILLDVHLGRAKDPQEFLDIAIVPSAAGGARVALRRRLVEHPVLDVSVLTEDEAQWWRRNRSREADQLADWLGLHVELRAEGAVVVDPEGQLSDRDLPGTGTAAHAALLVLERLVSDLRTAALADTESRVWQRVADERFDRAVAYVLDAYGRGFAQDAREPEALRSLVVEVLVAFGLLRPTEGGFAVHAAAARYATAPELVAAPTLFDAEE
jgi:uncharacterized protein (TIGR02678 family)